MQVIEGTTPDGQQSIAYHYRTRSGRQHSIEMPIDRHGITAEEKRYHRYLDRMVKNPHVITLFDAVAQHTRRGARYVPLYDVKLTELMRLAGVRPADGYNGETPCYTVKQQLWYSSLIRSIGGTNFWSANRHGKIRNFRAMEFTLTIDPENPLLIRRLTLTLFPDYTPAEYLQHYLPSLCHLTNLRARDEDAVLIGNLLRLVLVRSGKLETSVPVKALTDALGITAQWNDRTRRTKQRRRLERALQKLAGAGQYDCPPYNTNRTLAGYGIIPDDLHGKVMVTRGW